MAFTSPHYFEHLDLPNAANLQVFASNVTDLAAVVRGECPVDGGTETISGQTVAKVLQRKHRYLVCRQDRDNKDFYLHPFSAGLSYSATITKADADNEYAVSIVDLDEITWLIPGMLYMVENALFAFEVVFI